MQDLLREHYVESNDEVATWTLTLRHLLLGRVSDDIARDRAWHALACHAKLGLWGNNLRWRNEHFSVVKSGHSYWLHLQSLDKR